MGTKNSRDNSTRVNLLQHDSEVVEGTSEANTSVQGPEDFKSANEKNYDVISALGLGAPSKVSRIGGGPQEIGSVGCEGDTAATTTTLQSSSVVAVSVESHLGKVGKPYKSRDGKIQKPYKSHKEKDELRNKGKVEKEKSSRLTLFQNVSNVFSRVYTSMLGSSNKKTLPPGTLETMSDTLDDLKQQL